MSVEQKLLLVSTLGPIITLVLSWFLYRGRTVSEVSTNEGDAAKKLSEAAKNLVEERAVLSGEYKRDRDEARAEAVTLKARITVLENEIIELRERQLERDREISELQDKLNGRLTELLEQHEQAQDLVNDLRRENMSLRTMLKERSDVASGLKVELDAAKLAIRQMTTEKSQ